MRLEALPPTRRLIIRGDVAALVMMGVTPPETCRATRSAAMPCYGSDRTNSCCWQRSARSRRRTGIVDVSHRDTALAVSGPRAAWAINAFCALDLHPAAFPVGMCTRTVFGKAEIVLWRTAAETFRIEVARSFAPYVWACLEEARREFLE